MTLLRDLSLVWSLIHVLVLFIFFYESRFSRKKTLLLTCIVMIPVGIMNILGVILYGPELMGQLVLLTCTLPSAIFFFFIAKNRNWKFLFTFCVVDTVSYEIIVISRLLDYYIAGDKYILMFILRLIAFPVMEWLAYRYLRKPYLELQRSVKSGWGMFTVVSVLYYVLLLLMVHFPTMIIYRTEYVPAVLLMFLLMPATYTGFYIILRRQLSLIDAERREQTLKLQAVALEQRIEETAALEKQMKIQRHDMRHRYSVLSEMLAAGKYGEARAYLDAADATVEDMRRHQYCNDPVIDAVFAYHVRRAEGQGIDTDVVLSIPTDLDINTLELSVVLANVLENAINANLRLPQERRFIKCRGISSPQFVFQISNPFEGQINFDPDGLPETETAGHGTGVRSVMAFCEKHDVYAEFTVEDGCFIFRMTK